MNTLLRLSAMIIAASGVYATASEAADEETTSEATPTHMPAEIRSTIDKLVIIAGPTPEQQDITGSYEKVTPGLLGGMSEGSRLGTLSKEIGGVNVNFPVPILTLPGAIAGGISGKAQRDIQEFRDALTEDLAKAANQTLSNDGLALDIYRDLQRVEPKLDSHLFASTTPIDDATDAVLYAGITGVSFDIQEDDAILTTIAEATLRNASDGSDLYKKTFHYQDRDTLKNWTANDKALWRDYANFSRHYLGREIAADLFDRIDVNHRLQPRKNKTVKMSKKKPWQASSKVVSPTLTWESMLDVEDDERPEIAALTEADILYDVEIYDQKRPVYTARRVIGNEHAVTMPLEGCKRYRWSVRPTYRVHQSLKSGTWMRAASASKAEKGLIGRNASTSPAYTQDFATLDIDC